MKKIIFTKVIFIFLLLSSMVWSATKYDFVVLQSCGGKLTSKNGNFTGKNCDRDYSVDAVNTGVSCTAMTSYNSETSLETTTSSNRKFTGWTVVSGNCSFTDASKASTKLKLKGGGCVVKANRTFVNLLTLQAGTGGSVVGQETNCGYEEQSGGGGEGEFARIFPAIEWYGFYDPKYTVNVSATPNDSYRFVNWTVTSGSGNCTIEDKNSKNTTIGVNDKCTVKANFIKIVALTVTASTGGSVSPTSKKVDVGSKVNISATPNTSYRFVNWTFSSGSDKCSIADKNSKSTSITVNGDCTIKANFKLTRTLTVTAGTGGSVSPTSKVVDNGGTWTITATPNSSYRFTGWSFVSGGSSCTLDDASATSTKVKVGGDCTVKASFVRTYTLKLSAGTGGETSFTSKTVDAGSKVDISASINQYGYRFDKWTSSSTNCTVADPTSSLTKVTVNGACTVTASFVQRNTFAIGPNIADAGTTSPYGYKTVDKGSSNSITATPKSGYRFDRWGSSSTSCLINNAASASTTVKVSGDCSITANFIKTYNVTVAAGTGGTTSPSASMSVDLGASMRIAATPESGYRFDKWTSTSASCVIINETSATSFVKVSDDCDVKANFIKTYTLDVYTMSHNGPAFYKSLVVNKGSSNQLVINPNASNYDFDKWVFIDGTTLEETSVSESVCKIENPTSPTAAKVVVNGDCSVAAKLRMRTIVNVVAEEGGTVSPSGEMQGHAEEYMNISAMPNESYRFLQWVNSANCRIEDHYNANTRVLPLSTVGCTVTAKFRKQARIVINAVENIDIESRDEYVDVGKTINVYPYRSAHDWQFSHFEYISGEQNCPVTINSSKVIITVNGDCEMKPVVVPYFELTEDFKNYFHYFNGEYSSVWVRFHAATEDSTWYYVEFNSPEDYEGIVTNFGTDAWKGNGIDSCVGIMDGLGCYFKSSGKDNYLTVSSQSYYSWPFSVKYSKVSTDYVDVEYDLVGKLVKRPTIDVGHGMKALIKADDLTGYVFKEWKLMDGDCELDSLGNKDAHVLFRSSRCRYRAVYEADPAANIGFEFLTTFNQQSVQCGYISMADSTKMQFHGVAAPRQVSYVEMSDYTVTYDGDTLHLYLVGDTVKLPIANSALRAQYGADTLWNVVVEISINTYLNYYRGVYACMILPDGILNGDEHTLTIYGDYAGKTLSWEQSGPEPMYHDPDAPDIIKLSDMETGSDSIVRTTEKLKIEVQTQDFSDDIWTYDAYLIDVPATIATTLPVKVSCLFSEDEETLDLTHVGGGVYSLSNLAKSEGKAVKGDSMLTCATNDMIVTEFVDPFYKTITRDTTTFGDVVPVEYVFLEDDLVRDIDSVETTEVSFGFSLNMVSPTYNKVDTIIVALFTDLGDTLWVPAFETEAYSGVFEGHSSFRFVTSKKELKDDLLDAAMDLNADTNRAVIRMQIGKDKSALDSRDSIVVFYGFIPADSAEIQDQDKDGQADFVRVHFAKSILQEQLKVDTLFWGGAEDIGRGVAERDMDISAEGDWIDVTLESPFGYGVTGVDSTGKKFVSISRNTSSAVQKVYLFDKVGPVPVRAVKRPGLKKEEDFLNDVDVLPLDTLVVTMSEPVEKTFGKNKKAWSKLFQYSEECGSGKVHPVKLKEEPKLDKSGRVWTMVLPRETDARAGYCLMTNPAASIADEYGNAPGIGGVVIEGEDSQIYLYSIRPYPAISLDTLSAIRTETQMAYRASVSVFDNIGNVIAQFRTDFGKNGELDDDGLANPENSTHYGYIEWNQRTKKGRQAGTGVYIWKIKFLFDDGHKETRTVRTGIRRR